jgi:hypothetical protein
MTYQTDLVRIERSLARLKEIRKEIEESHPGLQLCRLLEAFCVKGGALVVDVDMLDAALEEVETIFFRYVPDDVDDWH